MHVVRGAETQQIEIPGFVFQPLIAPSRGATELCTWRLTVDPGVDSGTHSLDREEVFVVLAGEVEMGADDVLVRRGDAVSFPAGTAVRIANRSAERAELLVSIGAGFTATAEDGTALGTPPWAL